MKNNYLELLKATLSASVYPESAWTIVESSNPVKSAVVKQLAKRGYLIVKRLPYDPVARTNGEDWPMMGYTMTGVKRLDCLQTCVESVLSDGVLGDLVETGAWRGGSCMLMRAVLKEYGSTDRYVWCADSFEGMPVPTATEDDPGKTGLKDLSARSYLNVSLEEVQENFKRFGLLDDQVKFLKGWFCDTLQTFPDRPIAVLRLDGDLYESTMSALNALYPKVSKGGYVIIDDYNSWESCKHAVTSYRTRHDITGDIIPIDRHSVYWIKK